MSELLKINVNEHTEKKNGLTYLSWAWAWAEVLKVDPQARWVVEELEPGKPVCFLPDGSALVAVAVTIKGDKKSCVLPVMDHRNKAIKNPDAFAVNTAMMRCLAKAIAMHGLGLYIYAGEDLPESDTPVADEARREIRKTAAAGLGGKNEALRTRAMKVRGAIQEHLANAREMGALQEWQAITSANGAKSEAEFEARRELASMIWRGLTTPEQNEIRRLQNEAREQAYVDTEAEQEANA